MTEAVRRLFNKTERAVLYLAADGKCSNPQCATNLGPGWHGDHVQAWVNGGPTDLINGQALCPDCNLKKGRSTTTVNQLRSWQNLAIAKFHQLNKPNYLVSATPGAGKTTFALALGKELLDAGLAQRIAVVVPTDTLRQQWADAAADAGIALMPVSDASDYDKDGYLGYVATYAQLARGAGAALARRATRFPTAVFLDEIHHAGQHKSWGDGLLDAYEHAVKRVCLTGTPWRQNKQEPIPFVDYVDGSVCVDFPYEYGEAVADGVCRPVEFHAYDGEAQWRDCGTVKTAVLGSDMDDDDVNAALDACLRPDLSWMPALLSYAAGALDELRQEVPDAGGLVVAQEQWQARAYADILQSITGERPTIATSDDPNAKSHIDAYRAARSRWLVSVRMVSEGVDIPRLGIVVFAAKAKTPLFFRQVVGRIVRKRAGDPDFNSRMFIPAVPALLAHAAEIEDELRHQLEIETANDDRRQSDAERRQPTLPMIEPLGASEAVFGAAIFRGGSITPEQHQLAELKCRQHGIPLSLAVNVAELLNSELTPVSPASQPPAVEVPRWRREGLLRSQIDSLAGKYAHRAGMEKKDVNTMLSRQFGPRKHCSVETLEQMHEALTVWIGEL